MNELEQCRASLSALINRLVVRSATLPESWDVLIPDRFSPLGFSWWQDMPTRQSAIEVFSKAWGFDEMEKAS